MSGEDEKTKLDVTQEISTKSTPPFSAEYPQDDVSQGPNPAYDKSTLYVSGIPQGSDEKQIRQLFSGYGQLKHVRLVANHRKYLLHLENIRLTRNQGASSFPHFSTLTPSGMRQLQCKLL